jgi:hypothetical protein
MSARAPHIPIGLALAVALATSAGAVRADHDVTSERLAVALQGRLVDVPCFALRRAAQERGREAPRCRDGAPGHPVGVLAPGAAGGTLYVLATPPMALAPHLGRDARLEGERSPLGDHLIKPETLEVHTAQGWAAVPLLPDM